MKTNVIWLDENLDNEVKRNYIKELRSFGSLKFDSFKKLDKAIKQLKKLEFEETKVIISGELFNEFVSKFKENITEMCIAPKIMIFAEDKKEFLEKNKDYKNNIFYNFGGVVDTFIEVKKFLISSDKPKYFKNSDDVELTFEYIDKKEKLLLPLFYKILIDNASNDNMDKYTLNLYTKYSKNQDIKKLLDSIKYFPNIPIEILSKYYAKLYTIESDFYKNLIKDLGLNKVEQYLPYIKTLYEGVKLKSLPLANDNILFSGIKVSNDEIKKIKNYINIKIKDLPSSIVFSKSFLSFSKKRSVAEFFFHLGQDNKKYSRVLFILEKNDKVEYSLATHGDIEKISFYPDEREVLFFPFSSFEIKDIKEIQIGDDKGYEINLLYLGKYLKDIENDPNIILSENKLPDSQFKKKLIEFGLIKKEKIEKMTKKQLYNEYKQYEKKMFNLQKDIDSIPDNEMNKNQKKNSINAIIKAINYNKYNNIINSFENSGAYCWDEEEEKNEKEIKKNIEIKINGKLIHFSYGYEFKKPGNYNIEYIFKNFLTKTNYIFFDCKSIISLDLANFNTERVTNMSGMFKNCYSLISLNLSNFNTENVTNMSSMFNNCYRLISLNLLNFNTEKVTNMSGMFNGCNSLKSLNLTNFNTKKVFDMRGMFDGCNSLKSLNLTNFNTENVKDMRDIFSSCKTLVNLDISNFNTGNVNDMSYMFNGCKSLVNLDLSNFNTENVNNMSDMFKDCNSLKNLNLSNFNTENIKDKHNMSDIFDGCYSLKKNNIITNDKRILKEFDNKNY